MSVTMLSAPTYNTSARRSSSSSSTYSSDYDVFSAPTLHPRSAEAPAKAPSRASQLARSINPLKGFFKRALKSTTPSPTPTTTVEPASPVPTLRLSPIRQASPGYIQAHYGAPERLLGSGTGGSVYLHQPNYNAFHSSPTPSYAVKIFSPAASANPTHATHLVQRLEEEARLGRALQHPNIIRTFDYVQEANGTYYSVMEYCPRDMFDMVESGALTPADIDCYFVQLLHGVHHMHSEGMAHRDLKLDNVCLSETGQVKIIDFGCTTAFDRFAPAASGVCGSDPYIAPEVFHNDEYDPRKADVWALAVILLSMMSNHFPWEVARSSDPNFRMYLCYKDAIVDHWMANKPQAAATIKRMLALNPLDRPTTAELLLDPWVQSIPVCVDYLQQQPQPSPAATLVDFDYSSDSEAGSDCQHHYHYLPQRD